MATKPIDYCRIVDGKTSFRAINEYGRELRSWDDAFGDLWVYRDADGVVYVVRELWWEDAYSAIVDECLPDARLEPEDIAQIERGETPEGVQIRGGAPANPDVGSTIFAAYSLNGERLERLTYDLMQRLEITLIAVD